jgi:acyl-CoA thioesterase
MRDFQELINSLQARSEPGLFNVSIDESWLQGRTAFGGLSTALIIAAMQRQVVPDRRLRTLSVLFVGPVGSGEHQIQLRKLRSGGSVSHLQGELLCNGEVGVTVLAAYGKDRASMIRIEGPVMPSVIAPESAVAMPYIEGITPEFTRHFDIRLSHGSMPFCGAETADFGMWLRFPKARPIDLPALVALADVPPMPGLNMLKPPAVGSSLSWHLEFPAPLPVASASDWWYYDYRCQSASDGYYNNFATIWGPDKQAIMFSRQVATIFEK